MAKISNVDGHKELNGLVNCIGFTPNGVTAVPFVVVEVRREYAITMPVQHGGGLCLHIDPLNTPNLWTGIMHCALRRITLLQVCPVGKSMCKLIEANAGG